MNIPSLSDSPIALALPVIWNVLPIVLPAVDSSSLLR